jgi:hypothetical protein
VTTLGEDYLAQFGGLHLRRYHQGLKTGLRRGQAFFNALPKAEAERLRGSVHDPFYFDAIARVDAAVEFLLETS